MGRIYCMKQFNMYIFFNSLKRKKLLMNLFIGKITSDKKNDVNSKVQIKAETV